MHLPAEWIEFEGVQIKYVWKIVPANMPYFPYTDIS
jgi:hypothetical protein